MTLASIFNILQSFSLEFPGSTGAVQSQSVSWVPRTARTESQSSQIGSKSWGGHCHDWWELIWLYLTGKPQETITHLMDGRCRNDWNGWQVQNEDVTICDLCQVFGNPFSFRAWLDSRSDSGRRKQSQPRRLAFWKWWTEWWKLAKSIQNSETVGKSGETMCKDGPSKSPTVDSAIDFRGFCQAQPWRPSWECLASNSLSLESRYAQAFGTWMWHDVTLLYLRWGESLWQTRQHDKKSAPYRTTNWRISGHLAATWEVCFPYIF